MTKKKKTAVDIVNRTCIEKVQLTKEEADKFIDSKARKGKVLYYYKCPFCCCYHISKLDHSVNTIEIV